MPLRYCTPHGELPLFSTTTVFGTPLDVTVTELAIESFYPANDTTAATLRGSALPHGALPGSVTPPEGGDEAILPGLARDPICATGGWAVDGRGQRHRARPLASKAPVMGHSPVPMTASQLRSLIVKPTTARAIQTESDPEHQSE